MAVMVNERDSGGPIDLRESPALGGRVLVITGGASRIGRATALAAVRAGARVCVVDRDLEGLRATVALAGPAAPILYLQCDAGNVAEVESAVDFIERFDRPVDGLVHAAWLQVDGAVATGAVADLDEQYLVNLRGPYLISQLLLTHLVRSRGSVVFVDPPLSDAPGGERAQAAVGRAALHALANALREEIGAEGVTVTTVASSGDSGRSAAGRREALAPFDVAEQVVGHLRGSVIA